MGAELARIVCVAYAGLNGRAFKVLNTMAWTALDRPNADGLPSCLYFAGWEPLALALGLELPSDEKRRGGVYENVRRVLAELEKVGAIERLVDHPRSRNRQTFRLTLVAALAPPDQRGSRPAEKEGLDPAKTAGQKPRQNGGVSPAETAGPRKDTGRTEDSPQESTTPPPAQVEGPANASAAKPDPHVHEFEPTPGRRARCQLCPHGQEHPWHRPHVVAAS